MKGEPGEIGERERRFMQRAIDLSLQNVRSGDGGPFGAVVVRGEEILAEGTNAVTASNDPTAHAEIVAIRAACNWLGSFQLEGCEIYTSCEPCPMCFGAIYWARPDRVYFAGTRDDAHAVGFDDAFIYEQCQLPPSERSIPMIPLMRSDGLEAFRYWEASRGKNEY